MSEEPRRLRTAVDQHVGARIRERRKMMRMSQQQLAEALGLTFQQVQKYERGTNRVSASKLFETASALSVPISFFFEGLDDEPTSIADDRGEHAARSFLRTEEGAELARTFPRLAPGRVRQKTLELVRSIVATEHGATAPAAAPAGALNVMKQTPSSRAPRGWRRR